MVATVFNSLLVSCNIHPARWGGRTWNKSFTYSSLTSAFWQVWEEWGSDQWAAENQTLWRKHFRLRSMSSKFWRWLSKNWKEETRKLIQSWSRHRCLVQRVHMCTFFVCRIAISVRIKLLEVQLNLRILLHACTSKRSLCTPTLPQCRELDGRQDLIPVSKIWLQEEVIHSRYLKVYNQVVEVCDVSSYAVLKYEYMSAFDTHL